MLAAMRKKKNCEHANDWAETAVWKDGWMCRLMCRPGGGGEGPFGGENNCVLYVFIYVSYRRPTTTTATATTAATLLSADIIQHLPPKS